MNKKYTFWTGKAKDIAGYLYVVNNLMAMALDYTSIWMYYMNNESDH